ncbi:MAG TPA: MATE family efflux transporter [Gemmatimonadaceae bacterium]|nr:MATE family efflux transporter [Gemmatimonadaceae bacterium]
MIEPAQTTSLPVEPHEGIAPVAVADRVDAAHLVAGSLRATILSVAAPAVASSLLMTLFSSVDAFWVGTRIGAAGLAAVSTSLFWIWMIISLAEMVGVGLTAVAARRHGELRATEAARLAGDALAFSIVLGLIVAAIGTSQLDSLFRVMHTPADVTALGRRYLRTYLLGTPLIYGFFAVDASFRASGDTRTPFVLLLSSVLVTLVLDPLLILGIGPFPRLGIAGAAIATVGTRGVVCVLGAVISARRNLMRLGRIRAESIRAVCRVGLPTAMTGVTFSVIYVVLTRTTTRFGTPALAALGIGHRVESWLFMIGVGFGAATAAIVGQNLGAGRAGRAERAGWIATGFCTMLGVVACALELGIPREFASLFTNDSAVIAEAVKYLRIASISQLAVCAEVVLEGALGGAGETVPPMITSTALTASRIPLAGWAANRWGSAGIWWVISLTAIGRGMAMAALWRHGRWKRRRI